MFVTCEPKEGQLKSLQLIGGATDANRENPTLIQELEEDIQTHLTELLVLIRSRATTRLANQPTRELANSPISHVTSVSVRETVMPGQSRVRLLTGLPPQDRWNKYPCVCGQYPEGSVW